jgi:anti-sigma regulatory factor (Ser/Thr protein kinase)
MGLELDDQPSRLLLEAALPETVPDISPVRVRAREAMSEHNAADGAELVVSELTANAVLHGECPSVLRIYALGDCLLIEVEDNSAEQPVMGPPLKDNVETSGRGLRLVEALSDNFGFTPLPARGKVVWARLCSG